MAKHGREPGLMFCVEPTTCPIANLMATAAGGVDDVLTARSEGLAPGSSPRITGRVLRVTRNERRKLDEWMRVSGDRGVLKKFLETIGGESGIHVDLIFSNRYSAILRIEHDLWDECMKCPLLYLPAGLMTKSLLVTTGAIIIEIVSRDREAAARHAKERGCSLLRLTGIEGMDYMLTPRQEQVLITAYMMGYYETPKKAKLEDVAMALGLSTSTVAELLSKAESKIVEAFVRHELPHYMAFLVLNERRRSRRE